MRFKQFTKAVTACLPGGTIFLDNVRELAFFGIPDEIRDTYWKILLQYYSTKQNNWSEEDKEHKNNYNQFVVYILSISYIFIFYIQNEFIINPNLECGNSESKKLINPLFDTWKQREDEVVIITTESNNNTENTINNEEKIRERSVTEEEAKYNNIIQKWNDKCGDINLLEDIWKVYIQIQNFDYIL